MDTDEQHQYQQAPARYPSQPQFGIGAGRSIVTNSLRSNSLRERDASIENPQDADYMNDPFDPMNRRQFNNDDLRSRRPYPYSGSYQPRERSHNIFNNVNSYSTQEDEFKQRRPPSSNYTRPSNGLRQLPNGDGEPRVGYQGRTNGYRQYTHNTEAGPDGQSQHPPRDYRNQTQPYVSRVHSKGLLPFVVEEGYDSFITVLMVAEKPSIAKSIAEALGGSGYTTRKGLCKYTNVFSFYGSIFGKRAMIKVTSVIGHIYTTDFTEEFQDWRRVDPYKLFNATTQKKETNPDSQILQHLQKEASGASYLILWLDNDREGENICFEVLTACKPELEKEDFQQVFRAKFSSITPLDIRQAFDELSVGPNLNESIAVDARQVIDLKVGVAFSRFQTRYLVRKYEDLNNRKITFGPCQTPTLAFCVQRDDEIRDFDVRKFYKVIPKISLTQDELISLDWQRDRTYDELEANSVQQELENIGIITVTKVDNKETQKAKPVALNTVNYLKLASRQYGIGPQSAMQVAEKLYLGGYITYPRTESTKYAERFDFQSVLSSVAQMPGAVFAPYAVRLLQKGFNQSKFGKDVGDHPPITPTTKVVKQTLSKDELHVYELVCRHFLASISPDCRLYKKKVVFQSGTQNFNLTGTAVIEKGFMEMIPWQKIHENEIPNFQQGDQIYLHSVEMHKGSTQPPDHLSESDLIGLMESNGIGTDASMAQHITNICDRQYVTVEGPSRRLIPTELGLALIHAYNEIDSELVAPNLRSSIEKSVELIALGQLDKDHVLQSVIELFKNKYLYFVSKVGVLDQFFDPIYQSIESTINNSQYFTKCGRCKSSMRLLEKIGKVFCENCKFMYGLPRDSKFSLAGDCFCPIDGFQLILVEQQIQGITKRFTLCPLCFQKPPEFDNFKPNEKYSRTSCNLCTSRACQFSMTNNEVGVCQHCKDDKGGRFVLDWPINDCYSMTCNACNFQYGIVNNGIVARQTTKCTGCLSYNLKIETIEGWKFSGCVFCDATYRGRLEERKPVPVSNSETNPPFHEKRYFTEQDPVSHGQGQGFRRGGSLTEESSLAPRTRRFPPTQLNYSIPPMPPSIQAEKENSSMLHNSRKLITRNTRSSKDNSLSPKSSKVDFVKRGIQKTSSSSSIVAKRKFGVPDQYQSTYNASKILLEDSYQQDLEFMKKFSQPQEVTIPDQQEQEPEQDQTNEDPFTSTIAQDFNKTQAQYDIVNELMDSQVQWNSHVSQNPIAESRVRWSDLPMASMSHRSSAERKDLEF